MKRHILIFLGMVTTIFAVGLLKSDSANAYYTNENGKECYALMLDPKQATSKICSGANGSLNKLELEGSPSAEGPRTGNGKVVVGKTGLIETPKLELTKKNNNVKLTYCEDGTITTKRDHCKKGKPLMQTFSKKDYATFRELAEAIQNFVSEKTKYNPLAIDDNGDGSNKCKSASKYLGWIICPIIELAGSAADKVYNETIAPALNIEPQVFTNGNSATEEAWNTFRNFANIIFIILFLIIIFSQLTGVGIDNYGIKKALPKMVVGAVLINLSYILCIVAVDVSNILGNAFQALFTSLGENLKPELSTSLTGQSKPAPLAVTAGSLVGLGAFGYLAYTTAPIWGPAMLLSLLVAAISLVTTIFFLFILLSAREAAIVVLTVVSPIAVVLYALPNTKSYFNKWLKFFGALLMVYPIAGLLVGGGNYVSALLLYTAGGGGAVEEFSTVIMAMIIGVIPIFFIPAVLRRSLSAAGNIGAKISGFGQKAGAKLGGMASNRVQNSQAYQNLQGEAAYRHKQRTLKRTTDKLEGKKNRSAYQNRLLANAYAGLQEMKKADVDAAVEQVKYNTNNGANTTALAKMLEENQGNAVMEKAITRVAGEEDFRAKDFLKEAGKKNIPISADMAKEIATGSNFRNFVNADPRIAAYASAVAKGSETRPYNEFEADPEALGKNIANILESGDDIAGLKDGGVNIVKDLMRDKKIDQESINKIADAASAAVKQSKLTPGKVSPAKLDNIRELEAFKVVNDEPT